MRRSRGTQGGCGVHRAAHGVPREVDGAAAAAIDAEVPPAAGLAIALVLLPALGLPPRQAARQAHVGLRIHGEQVRKKHREFVSPGGERHTEGTTGEERNEIGRGGEGKRRGGDGEGRGGGKGRDGTGREGRGEEGKR